MPASVRFVLALLVLAAVGTVVAVPLAYGLDGRRARVTAEQITGGSVAAGRRSVERYHCGGCHMIPGVGDATGRVGPALAGVGLRSSLAGTLANTPDNMALWLQHPQAVVPGNGMPEQGVTPQEARDMGAFLYTLRH